MSRIKGKYIVSYKADWTTNLTETFAHNLDSTDLQVTLWDKTDNSIVYPDSVIAVNSDTVQISVSEIPVSGLRIVILGL